MGTKCMHYKSTDTDFPNLHDTYVHIHMHTPLVTFVSPLCSLKADSSWLVENSENRLKLKLYASLIQYKRGCRGKGGRQRENSKGEMLYK